MHPAAPQKTQHQEPHEDRRPQRRDEQHEAPQGHSLRVERIRGRPDARQLRMLRTFASDVYDRAFHDKHREPAEEWLGRLLDGGDLPRQHASLAVSGGEVVGGALSETYPGDLALLTYIVVRRDWWGRRVGGALMREAREEHAGATLIAEMADPDLAAASDREEAFRRARVLGSWGWRAIGCSYHQPPLAPGGAWSEDLILLHHGDDTTAVPTEKVDLLVSGLRASLSAGDPPRGLRHRFPEAAGDEVPTYELDELLGAAAAGATPHTAP